MKPVDCPFQRVKTEIERMREATRVIIVDFHGEATAEKLCMGSFLDGKVTAVLGTHTHVPTADERVLPGGTAYITDVGMCGSRDSVLGMRPELAIRRMMLSVPLRLEPARENVRLHGVVLEIEVGTGRRSRFSGPTGADVPPSPENQDRRRRVKRSDDEDRLCGYCPDFRRSRIADGEFLGVSFPVGGDDLESGNRRFR